MPAPTVTDFTRRWYDSLPELYRTADLAQTTGGGFPLLRWISLIGDQAGAVEALADRIDAGELTDPDLVDAAWLPWLAQFVGVQLPASASTPTRRDLIKSAASGWQAGTRAAIAAAANTALVGTAPPPVSVRPSPTDQWTIQLVVAPVAAPAPGLMEAAVIAAGAKPAGFVLEVVSYVPGWDDVDALGPTWASYGPPAVTGFGDLDNIGA